MEPHEMCMGVWKDFHVHYNIAKFYGSCDIASDQLCKIIIKSQSLVWHNHRVMGKLYIVYNTLPEHVTIIFSLKL